MTPLKNTIVVRDFKVVPLGVTGDIWINDGYAIRYIILENGVIAYPRMDELLSNIKNIL